jgi:hypothetical protein
MFTCHAAWTGRAVAPAALNSPRQSCLFRENLCYSATIYSNEILAPNDFSLATCSELPSKPFPRR